MKKYLVELIATFILVFCGTGAVIVNEITSGSVGLIGIALATGLVVMTMVCAFGAISGANINPAVTIGLALCNKIRSKEILPYIISQLAGALLASAALKNLFPESKELGITLPAGSAIQSVILETILTFILMFTILRVLNRNDQLLAGFAIGAVIIFEILFAGNISGASMNPARSIAPAVMTGNYQHLWIYIAGPVAGSIGAVLLNIFLEDKNLKYD